MSAATILDKPVTRSALLRWAGGRSRGALRPETAHVSGACLSARGVVCRVCGDLCDARAISFRLATGGRARPLVDGAACTGCGACLAVCPARAIEIA